MGDITAQKTWVSINKVCKQNSIMKGKSEGKRNQFNCAIIKMVVILGENCENYESLAGQAPYSK